MKNKNNPKISRILLSVFLILLTVTGIFLCSAATCLGDDTVLTVKEGDTVLKEFTLTELGTIATSEGNKEYNYSAYNTYPAGKFQLAMTGPTLEAVIDAAYYNYAQSQGTVDSAQTVDTLSDNTIIQTKSGDGYTTGHTVMQLFNTTRYYFPNITVLGASAQWYNGGSTSAGADSVIVPAIIALNSSGKLCFGQATPIEQIYSYFNDNLTAGGVITVLPDAAVKAASLSEVTPSTGSPVTAGVSQTVVFSETTTAQNAKIYYTISKDGSTPADPTIYNSYLYNVDTFDNNNEPVVDQYPVLDTVGTTIIKARYIEPGYTDGDVTTFTYNVVAPAIVVSIPVSGGSYTSGATLAISGTASGLTTVAITINDSTGNAVFTGSANVTDGSFSSSFSLPTVSAATTYTASFSGEGINTPVEVSFTVNPSGGGGGGGGGGTVVDEDAVLTISGDGVDDSHSYTLEMLEAFDQSVYTYSSINTWPNEGFFICRGIDLIDLLEDAGIKDSAKKITISSEDGYSQTFTYEELVEDTRYYFPGVASGSTSGKQVVPSTISLQYAEGTDSADLADEMRFCIGQRTVSEQNSLWAVQSVSSIVVSCNNPGQWSKPSVSVTPGQVAAGTEVKLTYSNLDTVKIYYTTNGDTPTIEDTMYNVSRTYYQPELNLPITINKDTTIKAIVVGNGKADSDVAVFEYTVDVTQTPIEETPTVDVEQPPGETIVSELSLSGKQTDGLLAGTLSSADFNQLLEDEADRWAAKAENQQIALLLDMANANSETTGQQLTIPAGVWGTIMNSAADQLIFDLGQANIVLDRTLLQELYTAGLNSSGLTVKLNWDLDETLSTETAAILGSRPLLNIEIYLNDTKVTSFNEGIKIEIPYTKASSETAENIIAFYIDKDGSCRPLTVSSYNADEQQVELLTDHLSNYGVGYINNSFSDTTTHWAKSEINFVSARGVVKGYGDSTFRPDAKVTRAEFVKMLYGCLGSDNYTVKGSSFTDVKPGDWYYECICWAADLGIAAGFGDGTFRPDQQITREQMAVILNNFATAMDIPLYAEQEAKAFGDQTKISDYAKTAVTKMQVCGILAGRANGNFDPQGLASRAEAAKLSRCMIEAALCR